MKMITRLLFSIFLYSIVTPVFSQDNWDLIKEKNGIKVFTSKLATSKFKSVKVEAILTGTLDKLVNLLTEAATNKDWIYGTNSSYIIKKISSSETLSYTETSVPWPASNRDIPVYMQLTNDPKSKVLKVVAQGVPDAIPVKKGIVRIPYFNSSWSVKYDGKSKLEISYFLEMDPGGNVPGWIYNLFVSRGPYETFNNLAGLLRK